MKPVAYYIVNTLTLYRLLMSPVLVYLIFSNQYLLFSYLLPISFFTDLIDGFWARKWKVSGKFGSFLDSIADDLTIVAALIGIFYYKFEFVKNNSWWFGIVLTLYVGQTIYALIKYKKISSFHTYLAKLSAILQGLFIILLFLLPEPTLYLFYTACIFTSIELIEEFVITYKLDTWQSDVKGLYWVIQNKSQQ